jgi:hypothetical protein
MSPLTYKVFNIHLSKRRGTYSLTLVTTKTSIPLQNSTCSAFKVAHIYETQLKFIKEDKCPVLELIFNHITGINDLNHRDTLKH